jgi:diadenosine tetraphosphate (Ap4A) HIT family hydrolase
MTHFQLHPRLKADSIWVRDMPLCQLRLQNQKAVPWLILVPRRPDLRELHHLNSDDQNQLMEEITQASRALESLFKPDKINVAALGNVVPQLHIHVIGRFVTDPAWPQPIWGNLEENPYDANELNDIQHRLSDKKYWPQNAA